MKYKKNGLHSTVDMFQVQHIDMWLERRKYIYDFYRKELAEVQGIRLPNRWEYPRSNCGYFPIFVEGGYHLSRDELYVKLKGHQIYARRYIYQLISDMSMYHAFPDTDCDALPMATSLSQRVLCLPVYSEMEEFLLEFIVGLIKKNETE